MINTLYPLRFKRFFKKKIWGGNQLKKFSKNLISDNNIGESWEISDIQGYLSTVINGPLTGMNLKELITIYKEEFLGEKIYKKFGIKFPLLIKFIDAKEKLSIQVHPNDRIAKQKHNCFGKNEVWYIIKAEKFSELIIGFKKKISKEEYSKLNFLEKEKVLNKIKVKKGQVYYLPAGCIHAIGSGIFLAEIQQSSDITYRIYDYNRKDKNEKIRELHTELALEAIDFSLQKNYNISYKIIQNKFSKIINTNFFKINILSLQGRIEKKYEPKKLFKIFLLIEGNLKIKTFTTTEKMEIGDTILLPASIDRVDFISNLGAKLLEITV